jgi:DNA (cytosine-5)-methyltransferase 1
MEASGYAIGAADLCAAGVGAPHIRQRLWFVAESMADTSGGRQPGQGWGGSAQGQRIAERGLQGGLEGLDNPAGARHLGAVEGPEGNSRHETRMRVPGEGRHAGGMADASEPRFQIGRDGPSEQPGTVEQPERFCSDGGLADSISNRWDAGRNGDYAGDDRPQLDADGCDDRPSATNGYWRDADWLHCRDGKWRPVEPGTFPLAHGAPARVGRLRAYGNAIVPQAAAEVIGAYLAT